MNSRLFLLLAGSMLCMYSIVAKAQQNNRREYIKIDGAVYSEKAMYAMMGKLHDEKKDQKAMQIVDSLIARDAKNGFFYYQRGIVNAYLFHHRLAIGDFEKAERLNYNKKKCELMIEFCNQMITDGMEKN